MPVHPSDVRIIIGRAGIDNREYRGRHVLELGYMIGKSWQRRGYGEEVARAVERFAADVLVPDYFYAFIHPDNEASIRLIRKLQYHREPELTEEGLSVWRKKM